MTENDLSKIVLESCLKIHRAFGPGMLESVYEELLAYELEKEGLQIVRQYDVPLVYENIRMKVAFKADIIVENKLILELKSVESVSPVHQKQLLTYLKLTKLKLGLLINFNEVLITKGIQRIVNGL